MSKEAEEIQIDQQALARSERVLDGLFGSAPPEDVVDDTPDDVVDDVADEEIDDVPDIADDVPADETVSDDEEEDWDSPKKVKKSSDDDEDPKDESAARKQAKLKGREAKELKTKLTERELELDRAQKERDELKARLEEVETTRIRPEDHPDFVDLRDSILADVEQASELLPIPSPEAVSKNFGNFMSEYMKFDGLKGEERTAARAALKGVIVDSLGVSDLPYADLDEDERRAFDGTTTEILKIIQRNVGKTKELQKLNATLTDKAKIGHLSVGVRAYENTVKEFKPILDSIGDLAEDVIEANPHAIESVVAKLAKESPEAAKRLEKAKADVLEAIVGPRALTQKEIDKLEANGTDVKQFMAERSKAHRVKQQKLAAFFVQGLMTRSVLKDTLSRLAKYEQDEDAENSEFDTIRQTTKKKAAPVSKEVRPKDRPSPLSKLFGDLDD